MIANRAAVLALACAAVCLAGCGYRMSASLDGGQSRTVNLMTVENRLFPHRPGYEYDFMHRLKDEIATDRRLVLVPGAADVVVQVALTQFTEPILLEDLETGRIQEVQVSVRALVVARGKDVPGGELRRQVGVSAIYAPDHNDPRGAAMTRMWRDLAREVLDAAADTEWASEG